MLKIPFTRWSLLAIGILFTTFAGLHGARAQTGGRPPYHAHDEARALIREISYCRAYFRLGSKRIYINVYGVVDTGTQDSVIRDISAARDLRSSYPVRLSFYPPEKFSESHNPNGSITGFRIKQKVLRQHDVPPIRKS